MKIETILISIYFFFKMFVILLTQKFRNSELQKLSVPSFGKITFIAIKSLHICLDSVLGSIYVLEEQNLPSEAEVELEVF